MSAARSRYIVSSTYDWAFFLLPPLAALWVGILIAGTNFSSQVFVFAGLETTAAELALGTLVHAHLVAVFFRSHGNADIFRRYPRRFVLIPILLYVAIVSSLWLAVTATVVATFWDVWHSGAQTFGFARIYDRNAGVPPETGRRLDLWMNQLLYAGPILAGATLIDHLETFESYEDVGALFFSAIPAQAAGYQRPLAWIVVIGGALLIAAYLVAQVRFYRQGHRPSPLKIFIVASTGLCSVYTWGFNSWGEAFFIMNLFHAVQYLALVWAMEKKRIGQLFRVGERRPWAAGLLFLASVFLYGFGAQSLDPGLTGLWAITIVVSLLHFWYDGFIWSVKKSQV
jgi:hypothetical protein